MKRGICTALLLILLCTAALSDVGITGDRVNLRTGPSVDYAVRTSVRRGTVLTDLGYTATDKKGDSWYYVENQGNPCWVSSRYAEREVITLDVPAAAEFAHKELLGRWKMTAHTQPGLAVEERSPAYTNALLQLTLVHDAEQGASLQGDLRLNDGVLLRRFLLSAEWANQPVTAWGQEIEGVETQKEGWSVRLWDPAEEGLWTLYLEPVDENRLTLYFPGAENHQHVFSFERAGEEDTDDAFLPEKWQVLDTEQLPGDWQAAYGRIDTYSYEAQAEGVDASLSFYRYERGEVWLNWTQSDGTEWNGIRITALDASNMRTSIDAPWYVDLTRFVEPGRRAYLYLEDAQTLYLVEEYTIDGMPTSDCLVYKRMAD